RAVADEQHGRLPILHLLQQAVETRGILEAVGPGDAAHRIAGPTEIAEDQRSLRQAPAQPRLQVAITSLLLDEAATQKDDAIAGTNLQTRNSFVGAGGKSRCHKPKQ